MKLWVKFQAEDLQVCIFELTVGIWNNCRYFRINLLSFNKAFLMELTSTEQLFIERPWYKCFLHNDNLFPVTSKKFLCNVIGFIIFHVSPVFFYWRFRVCFISTGKWYKKGKYPDGVQIFTFSLEDGIPEFVHSRRKSWTLDSRRWTLDAELWNLDAGRWTLSSGLWALDYGLWTLVSGLWALGAGLWTVDPGRLTLVARRWTMNSGRWTVIPGQWALDAGLWTLDSGRWMLDCGR